ncbi:UPF0449 protein C19orf25 homolog [Aplochiton taeniatus]
MNMGSKAKKRVVLPSRPDPPSVDEIQEDINRAFPNDPVFIVLEGVRQDGPSDKNVESKFSQSRRYLELNERLEEVRGELVRRRDELRTAGKELENIVVDVKGRTV